MEKDTINVGDVISCKKFEKLFAGVEEIITKEHLKGIGPAVLSEIVLDKSVLEPGKNGMILTQKVWKHVNKSKKRTVEIVEEHQLDTRVFDLSRGTARFVVTSVQIFFDLDSKPYVEVLAKRLKKAKNIWEFDPTGEVVRFTINSDLPTNLDISSFSFFEPMELYFKPKGAKK